MARIPTYLGPKTQVTPDDIERFERQGCWGAEEKRDGCWAEVKTDDEGRIVSLTSRVNKAFSGENVNGLAGLKTHLPNSTLVAELEAGSEAATQRYEALGYRRLHVFDVPVIGGQDLTKQPYEARRRVVEDIVPHPALAERLLIVRQATEGFQSLYNDVMAGGGEGLVFKKKGSLYRPYASDGKVDAWVRCKRYRFIDYVVLEIGKSASGQPNLQVGLYNNGQLSRVCTIKTPPAHLDLPALVGQVIECKGAEVFKSGALRHGHFERVRPDKAPEDCTLAAARAV